MSSLNIIMKAARSFSATFQSYSVNLETPWKEDEKGKREKQHGSIEHKNLYSICSVWRTSLRLQGVRVLLPKYWLSLQNHRNTKQ